MYYVMSIPEILVLLFVIGLWMLSIICCFKRYEKISTIERADMPTFNKKNLNNESLDTGSSLASKNITTNSTNNLNTSLNCSPSINNLNNRKIQSSTNDLNNSLVYNVNNFLNEKFNSNSLIPQNSSYQIIDECKYSNKNTSNNNNYNNNINNDFRYEIIAYERTKLNKFKRTNHIYHHINSLVNNHNFNHKHLNPNHHSKTHHRHHFNHNRLNYLKSNFNNSINNCKYSQSELQGYLNFHELSFDTNSNVGINDVKNNGLLMKSNSEPALKELINKITHKSNTIIDNERLLRSNSIYDQNNNINNPNNNYIIENLSSNDDKLKRKRSVLKKNFNKSLNDENLLNPHLIPKVIQKSLIDLHKKSVWNLSHKPSNSTLHPASSININNNKITNVNNKNSKSVSNSQLLKKSNSNYTNSNKNYFLDKNINKSNLTIGNQSYSGAQFNYTNATVFTQPKSKYEIKMKVIDN